MNRIYTDMLGRQVRLPAQPVRIVSLVPSQTELLYDLGLEERVVGITRFCVHPAEWFRDKTRVGGTKKLHMDKIRSLQPDLIIANKEENTAEEVNHLAAEFPVWISDINTVEEALQMINMLGVITGKEAAAAAWISRIRQGFARLATASKIQQKVAYLIWYRPWMVAGRETFIDDMLARAGWENVFGRMSRYPEISLTMLAAAEPDLILLSSEPFPFMEQHAAEIRAVIPNASIVFIDGEMCSWYGSRMTQATDYLYRLCVNPLR